MNLVLAVSIFEPIYNGLLPILEVIIYNKFSIDSHMVLGIILKMSFEWH